jgi:hypothetical protein
MQGQKVFIVGWESKTWCQIFGVFTDLKKALDYQSHIRRTYAPNGSDRDGSYVIERKMIIQGTLESLLTAEEIHSLLLPVRSNSEVVVVTVSESTLP